MKFEKLLSLDKHAKDNNITLFESLARSEDIQGLSPRLSKAISGFTAVILKHVKLAGEISISKLMKEVLSDTDYLTVLLAEKTAESLERADNVRELVSAAVQFEKANPGGAGLHGFLEEIKRWSKGEGVTEKYKRFLYLVKKTVEIHYNTAKTLVEKETG